ncbi:MAG TPA: MBL fold metallo-hydrolase [Pseudolabrys sp.]|nr:MBL fold metallo-hydrolase [Pseudolabrys sp.]
MKVVLLGTGGPRPDPRRCASATLVGIGDENLLFDAGRGVVNRIVQSGVRLDSINPVFVTHHHVDHIGDIYDVILATWMHGRTEALRIYGPSETRRIVETLLNEVYDKDWQWRSIGEPSFGGWKPVVTQDVSPGVVLDTGRWKVTADVVIHGNGLGFPKTFLDRWTCYGYRIEAAGKVLTISGDTVACDGIDRLAKDADVLVHCCYMGSAEADTEHFKRLLQYTMAGGDTVGKIAARARVKTLVLTHHRPRKDDSALQSLANEVARDFSGRILLAEDLMEIEV